MIKITLDKEPIHLADLVHLNGETIYIIDRKNREEFLCEAYGFIRLRDKLLSIRRTKYMCAYAEHLSYYTYGEEWIAYYVKRIVEDFT